MPSLQHVKLTLAKLFLLLLLSVTLHACYEPLEGCLNPRATNFNLDADESCPDCCTFPTASLRFTHVWNYGDTTLRLRQDTFYLDADGNPFRIEQVRFYGSEIGLETTGGTELNVLDNISLPLWDGSMDTTRQTVIDDFFLANSQSSSALGLGSVEPDGTLAALNWRFGLNPVVNRTYTGLVEPTSHPLAPQLGQLNYGPEVGYVFAQFTLYRDTLATDTIPLVVNVFGDANSQNLRLPLDSPQALIEGFNPILYIEVDYAAWLSGAQIRTADTTSLKTIFVNNLTNAFKLTALSNG